MNILTDSLDHIKEASTTEPVLEVIRHRWSPRGLSGEPLSLTLIRTIVEAGRWAPSAFNEQPWRLMIGMKPDATWQGIADTLDPFNHVWASVAPVLMLVSGKKYYSHNHTPNRHYAYDTGQMVAYMSLEARNHNVFCHQMAGFDAVKAAETFAIPTEEYDPLVVVAFAYRGATDHLNDNLRQRESAPRTRKPAPEIAFQNTFGEAWVV
jgi:nitroreductase